VLLAVAVGAVQNSLYVSPTSGTESAFFRDFTSAKTVKRLSCQSGEILSEQSAGAEIGSATHEKDFDQYFAIEASDWILVMKSLQADISSQLSLRDAQILDQTGDFAEGFRIHYKSGKSLGVITVEPLETVDSETHALAPRGVCRDGIAVRLRLSVQEKWYKKWSANHI
jgi:hypothetical protein